MGRNLDVWLSDAATGETGIVAKTSPDSDWLDVAFSHAARCYLRVLVVRWAEHGAQSNDFDDVLLIVSWTASILSRQWLCARGT